MPIENGTILNNRYIIESLLGQGGFGAVYKATDLNLKTEVAVKENLDTSPESQRQFLREATVLANLNHPNLPRVNDHFIISDQGQYLVMDFISGQDLQHVIEKDGPMETGQMITIILQVMDALIYLHNRVPPVLHRDIKPANIKLRPDGKAFLVDFGLVKLFDNHTKTTVGARAVTPGFSPPEQYGSGSTDPRTDIYALGATLYFLLTGVCPPESVQRISGDTLKPVATVNPRVSQMLSNIVTKSLAMNPFNRFSSMNEFRSALLNAKNAPASFSPAQQPPQSQPTYPSSYPQPVSQPTIPYSQPRNGYAYAQQPPYANGPQHNSYPIPPQNSSPYGAVQERKKGPWKLIIGFILGLLVTLVVICGILYMIGSNEEKKNYQATSAYQETQTAFEATNAFEATQKSIPTAANTLTPEPTIMPGAFTFGPQSGELLHTLDGNVPSFKSGANIRNFTASVIFYNPYAASKAPWDYGIIFRNSGKNNQFRLIINSDGTWELFDYTSASEGVKLSSGLIAALHVGSGESNKLVLKANGKTGELIINDGAPIALDLSARTVSGDVIVATSMYTGDEIEGASTRFVDFQIVENK